MSNQRQSWALGRMLVATATVLGTMAISWDGGWPARADIEGVGTGMCHTWDEASQTYVMAPCDFGSETSTDTDTGLDNGEGQGYGYGCASTTEYYDEVNTEPDADVPIGSPHPTSPNVLRMADGWRPAAGFTWATSDPNDLAVAPDVGAGHPDYPNIYMNAEGNWSPQPGFNWASANISDLTVVPVVGAAHPQYPNIHMTAEGDWTPRPGFRWASEDSSDLAVVPDVGAGHPDYPNIYMNAEGNWSPQPGFNWATYDPNDLATVPVVGAVHPDYPNVVMGAGGNWQPAGGYGWAGDPATLIVEPIVVPAIPASVDTASFSLRIVDVPSPTGYKSASERREQVARLSDDQIETEIARIDRLLRRMQQDFAGDAAAMDEWLAVAEEAEHEALKHSFDLLLGGTISLYLEDKAQLKSLYEIAKTGKLLLKASEEAVVAGDREANLRLARDAMLQLYKNLRTFDKKLVSAGGSKAAKLASFMASYSYEVARWALAYENIRSISDNLGGVGGKLKAQLAVKSLYEDLIQERNRRRRG